MERAADLARDFSHAFVLLFIAIDAVGVLPFFLALTQSVPVLERPRLLRHAILTALGIGLVFIIVGKGIFFFLGVTVADFLVAGGLILLVLSTADLLLGQRREEGLRWEGPIGVVPIGTPLIAGPAVLTSFLLLIDLHRPLLVVLAFVLNLAFTWVIFWQASRLASLLGTGALKGIAKVMSLLLAAIAVRMIRQGILEILAQ